jgi:hypothetical protein
MNRFLVPGTIRFTLGDEGDLWYRATNGDFIALPIPADYLAQRAAGTPYRLSIDDATGLPYWEATPSAGADATYAWMWMTTIDETGATVLMTDSDGSPIATFVPVT